MNNFAKLLLLTTASAALLATPAAARPKKGGTQAMELDPGGRGAISGIGIESRDIDAMADQVVRELMSRPDFIGAAEPPRIVVDSAGFSNDSSQRIDKNMITDALRASLNRAANGRMRFVSREAMMFIQQERELKREGISDVGTRGLTAGVSGLDYRLIGRMTTADSRDAASGLAQRRTQVVFEIIDMETGDIPWTGQPYTILRASGDDVVYR